MKNCRRQFGVVVLLLCMILGTSLPAAADQVAAPTANLESGTYSGTQTVRLSSETEDVTIYYTLDGTDPTTASTEYNPGFQWGNNWYGGGVTVDANATLKAIAVAEGMDNSEVAVFEYQIKAATPAGSPDPNTYQTWPLVTLSSATEGATIYYTTDGSDPTAMSTEYSGPIQTGETAGVIKAIAIKAGNVESDIATLAYSSDPNMAVLTDEASIPAVIDNMTLEEKVILVTGASSSQLGAAGNTNAIPRLNITGMELADGPAGVRLNGRYATAWPNPLMLASTWNAGVVAEIGEATANEASYYGVDIMLGPGLNLHRDPLGGRVFEYYSEDPYLTGTLGGAYVSAMQAQGMGATIKHYAANNAENNRMRINETISERTLRELYLPVWEIVTAASDPWAAMSAYNLVNGTYCSENVYLNSILKDTFGFTGLIMSDWGAYQGPQAFGTGFDLNTPGGSRNHAAVIAAVNDGTITEEDLDRAAERILKVVVKTETFKNQLYDKSDFAALTDLSGELKTVGAELSKRAALEGIVLLKNDGVLPLASGLTVGVAGEMAVDEYIPGAGFGRAPTKGIIFEGAGSACVNVDPDDIVSLVQGLTDGGLTVYQPADLVEDDLSVSGAEAAAASSDVGIVLIGRHGQEGSDVTSIDLHDDEIAMIQTLSAAYHAVDKKLIVLLNVAQPIAVDSWDDYADAILFVGLPGTYGAVAITEILTGEATPSGKLVDSWPKVYSDLPTSDNMPTSQQTEIEYTEGIYVGYRYFDQEAVEPMYPFGYGLSYTTFEYSDLSLGNGGTFNLDAFDASFQVSVKVTNTGDVAGKEIVQLYIRDDESTVDRPSKELKGFAKTGLLQPCASETVTFTITKRDLSYFDEKTDEENDGQWVAEPGTFTVLIGGSSDNAVLAENGVSATLNAVEGGSGPGPSPTPTPPGGGGDIPGAVPEPSTWILLVSGVLALLGLGRKKRMK